MDSYLFLLLEFYRQYLFWFCFFLLFQIGDALIEIASNIMLVDDHVLWMAQKEDKACTRIVRCVEQIASQILTSKTQVISKVLKKKITKCFISFFFSWILFARQKYFKNITSRIKKCFSLISCSSCDTIVFTRISY